jgi:ATP-dependent RNA helicase RhlE
VTFDELNLNKPLLKALAELEYENPTPIQEKAFPVIMSGRDVIGIAQTGTGKTFAYLLPVLRLLSFSAQKEPRVLIVVPTRELVVQIVAEIQKLTLYANIRTGGVYGGTNINTQKQIVNNGLDVLVATPGRLLDLALSGVLRLKFVQKLIIDEFDEMLNLGFRPQLARVIDLLPAKRQNLLFSATYTNDISVLSDEYFNAPEKIEIAPHGTPIDKIKQWAYHVPNYNTKVNLLNEILSNEAEYSKVLVFVSTRKLADRLFEQVSKVFPEQISVIHSNKSQNLRLNTVKQFHEGVFRVLIATDIIARGLDISDVSHVINFDTPEVPADYMHRVGRTGRADKDGVAITFATKIEEDYLYEIELMMHQYITIEPMPKSVVVSHVLLEEEIPVPQFDKHYNKAFKLTKTQGAFHEKKEKNKKINLGGPKQRNPKFGKPKHAKTTKPEKMHF